MAQTLTTPAIFGKKLKSAMAEAGMKVWQVAKVCTEKCGHAVTPSYISSCVIGRFFPKPEVETVLRGLFPSLPPIVREGRGVAAAVGVPPGELEGNSVAAQPRSAAEAWEPGYQKEDRESLPPDWRGHFIGVINRIAAGSGVDTTQAEQFMPGDADWFVRYEDAPPKAFGVEVYGRSAFPLFESGDVVVIDPDVRAEGGVCCVLYADEHGCRLPRLKRLRREGRKAILESVNPEVPSITIDARRLVGAYAIHDRIPGRKLARSP